MCLHVSNISNYMQLFTKSFYKYVHIIIFYNILPLGLYPVCPSHFSPFHLNAAFSLPATVLSISLKSDAFSSCSAPGQWKLPMSSLPLHAPINWDCCIKLCLNSNSEPCASIPRVVNDILYVYHSVYPMCSKLIVTSCQHESY